MIFRLYHTTKGHHIHCRLFAGDTDGALAKCGDVVFTFEQFEVFVRRFAFIELKHEREKTDG